MRTPRVRSSLPAPRRLLTGVLAGAAVALLLPASPLRAQELGTVNGRVVGEGGEPLAGATVSVTGQQIGAVARGDGSYRFMVRPGRYEIRARLIGYAPARDSIVVTAGGTTSQDFELRRAATNLEAIAVTGTRGEARSVINSPVPIDVLSAADIKSTGRTETAQILQQLAPSVNFPRASISDGTDHVRPATLRGLAPDQALVLVNGKRRHTGALVNVNGSVGRGSAAVDLNAIPASMIERIEVLRDGAAAQYGSDAIAGVVNIVLKTTGPGEISSTLGQTSEGDGAVAQGAVDGGMSSPRGSYFHAGAEYRGRGWTNRSLGDPRPQSFAEASAGTIRDNATGPVNHRQGDAATTDYVGFFSGGYNFQSGGEAYAFGGLGHRRGQAAGFFRRAQDDRTVRALWPNGFLPIIQSTILDGSLGLGLRGARNGVRYDLSTVYGRNTFDFDVLHSNNVSMGNASPTDFYAGQLGFDQSTTNLDLFREFRLTETMPLRVGVGGEYRRDGYKIKAGDEASYLNGGQTILDASGNPTTRPGAVGSQVFPGFTPQNATNVSRGNTSAYVDLETDITESLLLNAAGRYENYSDFGSTTNGKLAARYTIIPQVVLRGALGTGFRAPSLGQSYFQSTATNFIGGVPKDVLTLPVEGADARALGATSLRPEKSRNYSLGVALAPLPTLGLTVDYYQITIDDRIVLSENFVGPQIENYFLAQSRTVSGARFFTNAIDTKTGGLDVVGNYGLNFGARGAMKVTAGYNRNQTRVTHVDATPSQLQGQQEVLFGRVERARIEEGQPRSNVLASVNYDVGGIGFNVRAQRFGSVTVRNPISANVNTQVRDQTFSAKTITDVSLSYRFLDRLTVTAGADNVFDVYPDRNNQLGNPDPTPNTLGNQNFAGNSNFGIFPYNQFSPFGFNGRFVYGRFAYQL
jgi:iron complex outermembrane recepter protein